MTPLIAEPHRLHSSNSALLKRHRCRFQAMASAPGAEDESATLDALGHDVDT
jgi:hypothetical protein